MTFHLCQVTGTLVAPDGSTLPEVQVRFLPAPVSMRTPENGSLQGGALMVPHPVTVVTGVDAGLDVALAPGVYSVRTRGPGGREYPPFLVDVPGQEGADLADILLPLATPQSVYDAAASALVASKAAGRAAESAGLAARTEASTETTLATLVRFEDTAGAAASAAEGSAQTALAAGSDAAASAQDAQGAQAGALASAGVAQAGALAAQAGGQLAEAAAQQAQAGAQAAEAAADLARATLRSFASRAAFEAAVLPADAESWSVVHAGRVLSYRRDPAGTAITSANGVKGMPAGEITPLHWGAAAGAPAAVNTAALNACAALGRPIFLPAGEYDIAGTILFAPTAPTGRTPCRIHGEGPEVTVLRQLDRTADTLAFIHADPTRQNCIVPMVEDLSIHCQGATLADQGAAVRMRQGIGGHLRNITINGPTYGVVSERCGLMVYDNVYFRSTMRAQDQLAEAAFVLDHDPVLDLGTTFGTRMTACESQSGRGVRHSFILRAIDGLYVANSHFGLAEKHVRIETRPTGNRTVRDVMFSNIYFDANTQELPLVAAVEFAAPGSTAQATIFGIKFADCLFRGRHGQGVRFEGPLGGLDWLRSVAFDNCEWRGFTGPVIDLRTPAGRPAQGIIADFRIDGGTFNDGVVGFDVPHDNAMILAGSGVAVRGVTIRGHWTADGPRAIRVVPGAAHVVLDNLIFMTGRTDADNISVEPAAQADTWIDGAQRGSNAAGSWERLASGAMTCWTSYTLTGQEVAQSFGQGTGLWRSDNLMNATRRLIPMPFAAIPSVQVTVSTQNFNALQSVSANTTPERWPATILAITGAAQTDRTITVDLLARGYWR